MNADGSDAPDSGGEAQQTIVEFNVQDNECGALGYARMDFNGDCRVGLADFADIYIQWLICTKPYDNAHVYPEIPDECEKLWNIEATQE